MERLPLLLVVPLALRYPPEAPQRARILIWCGGAGFAYLFAQGFAIGIGGWQFPSLEALFGPVPAQDGMGYGAMLVAAAFLFIMTSGIALRGFASGDAFVVGSIGLIVALIALFVFFPVGTILASAFLDNDANVAGDPFKTLFVQLPCLLFLITFGPG